MLVGAELRRIAARIVAPSATRVSIVTVAAVLTAAVATAVSPPSVSAAGFSCASGGPSYEVRSGDSWYAIAARAGVSPSSLLGANDADTADVLVAGDRLCLPSGADLTGLCSSYTVRAGDSWGAIAVRVGSSATAVAGANGVGIDRTIHPGDVICLPAGVSATSASSGSSGSSSGSGGSYTVVAGDSWSAIAWRADVSMSALLGANGASARDVIVPGQVLRLPPGAKQPSVERAARIVLAAAPTQGPCGYLDTWGDARSRGRRHAGVDIFSGSGNYVYAVVDGRLSGRAWDGAGGNSGNAWMLTGADGNQYFYAHLSDFAPQLRVGSSVRAGQIIGWVGGTGNASAPHLHFEIRPGGGSPVNPYPVLRAQGACNGGRPYTQPGGWVPEVKR